MADNPTYAVDNISSVLYPRVKIAIGPDGTATADLAGRALGTDGAAYVDPRFYSADQEQASSSLTTSTTAYTAGDVLGAGWTFTSMARSSGGRGRITGIRIYDKADITQSISLFFASQSITFGTDNAAPSISDADMAYLLPGSGVSLAMTDLGGARIGTLDTINIPYVCGATSLYVYAITNVGHTFFGAAGDLPLRLFYELD